MAVVAEVAEGLQELREHMVFIGGAMISVYTDDPAADEIRPTSDIDLTVNLGDSYNNLVKTEERLRELEFYPDPEGHSICSYKYKNIAIDIMPAEDSPIGVSNSWYKPGFKYLQQIALKDGLEINVLSAPYFLATKFEAFEDRGGGVDYYGSHDFEDIVYVLDNRTTIVEEIQQADDTVRGFLIENLQKLMADRQAEVYLEGHISRLIVEERLPMLIEKIYAIINYNR